MIVRCFEGRSIPEVMERVRREMGEDAVILHTQQRRGWFWWFRRFPLVRVWAAVASSQPMPTTAIEPPQRKEEAPPKFALEPSPVSWAEGKATPIEPPIAEEASKGTQRKRRKRSGSAVNSEDGSFQSDPIGTAKATAAEAPRRRRSTRKRSAAKESEVSDIAQRVERQLELIAASLWGQEVGLKQTGVLGLLWRCGVDLTTIPSLFSHHPIAPNDHSAPEEWLFTLLCHHLPVTGGLSPNTKVAVLVGPTGVGKTTTVAKIAANQLMHYRRRVALLTVDVFRIGAVQQLETYARLMGLPFFVATLPEEAGQCIRKAQQVADLVLVDTIGRSPKHTEQLHSLWELVVATHPDEVLLTLPANGNPADLALAAEQFSIFCPTSLVITKLDEATQPGVIVNLVKRLNLPVAYITTGQNVPEDLEVPTPERLADWVLSPLREPSESALVIPQGEVKSHA